MAFDPVADVLRAHDAGLVLLSGPLECPGHVLLPWFAHAALRPRPDGGGDGSAASAASALVVLAAAHPPSAHAAALRKVQQQVTQQTAHAPLPVVYVEPRLPGPDEDDEGDEAEEEEDSGGGGAPWLRRLSADLSLAVRQQAAALLLDSASSDRRQQLPPQITVLVDSLTVLAAAADAGAGAIPSAASICAAPRPRPPHLRWLAFLHALASLEAQAPRARVRVVALCADDVPADAPWRRWLRHRCAAALALVPIEGRTAGLDGELRVEARAAPAGAAEEVDGGGGGGGGGAGLAFAAAAPGGWGSGGDGGGIGGGGRCFFRASELSVRWLRDVQSDDLMR